MSDKIKNILIGLFVLMAIMVTIATVLFLRPSIGDGKKTLNVRFANISGINVGTRVSFAGRPVGEVEEIVEVKDARLSKNDEFGRIYYYQLKLKVDSSVEVYDSDIIAIKTTGLMGEKSIGIIPKACRENSRIITNDIIYAKSVDSFENTADQIAELSNKAEKAISLFNNWFEKNSNILSTSLSTFSNILNALDANKISNSLNESIKTFANNMKIINEGLQIVEENKSFSKVNDLINNLKSTSDALCSKGNISKLLNDNGLYLKCDAILSKANTLFNDLNHYGLLYQYSKGWQRQRTKKANILASLNTPKQFKSYFENEIAEITTALNRINILVEKAQETKEKEKILKSAAFQKNFTYLLSQVESLLNAVKTYNENLADANSQ